MYLKYVILFIQDKSTLDQILQIVEKRKMKAENKSRKSMKI